MAKGDTFSDPVFRYKDSLCGREIIRLTDYLGHSNHLYFTEPCWCNSNRSFVFTSDRNNQSNLFRYDLNTHAITQLTELEGTDRPTGCFSSANNRHYYWWEDVLYELDVNTLDERILWKAEGEFRPLQYKSRPNPTADGRYVCSMIMKIPVQDKAAISFAYSRFREMFEAKPPTRIVKIEVATGKMEILHEDSRYIGHINTSPTLPNILSFCHEGPWKEIDQRIWGLDVETGKTWKIRSQESDNMAIGHEYWFADGKRMGYHGGARAGDGSHVFGHIKYDNTELVEQVFPFVSTHFHSLDENLIVGDGTAAMSHNAKPFIQLYKWKSERYVGPRILACHRSTFNNQHAHPHPRFTPDGKHVVYTSDLTRYSNIYMVEVGEFEDLPELD